MTKDGQKIRIAGWPQFQKKIKLARHFNRI